MIHMNEEERRKCFQQLELRDVKDTGRVLGRGAYGVVTEVDLKGLRYNNVEVIMLVVTGDRSKLEVIECLCLCSSWWIQIR